MLLASGCGNGGTATAAGQPDLQNGQKLFSSKCGYCHALQAAATSGTVGPNLDNAFAGVRAEKFAESSIANVILDQIRLGSGPVATYTSPEHGVKGLTPQQPMPANLVAGQDAIDVAAYVASVVGKSYVTPVDLATLTSGGDIFKLGPCGSCHTLKAAGTMGTQGPNLDAIAAALTVDVVARQVTNGSAGMPAFKGTLTTAQIKAVSKYVSSVAGK